MDLADGAVTIPLAYRCGPARCHLPSEISSPDSFTIRDSGTTFSTSSIGHLYRMSHASPMLPRTPNLALVASSGSAISARWRKLEILHNGSRYVRIGGEASLFRRRLSRFSSRCSGSNRVMLDKRWVEKMDLMSANVDLLGVGKQNSICL